MANVLATAEPFPPVIANAARDATLNFFKSSCGLNHVDSPEEEDDPTAAGIMSTISFVGNPAWTFALALPNNAAVVLAKAFAGFDIPIESPDMGDVLGEVVNVIAGEICARLDAKGIKAQMSLPSVVRGEQVSLHVPSGVSTTRLTFTGPTGKLWVKLIKARGHHHVA